MVSISSSSTSILYSHSRVWYHSSRSCLLRGCQSPRRSVRASLSFLTWRLSLEQKIFLTYRWNVVNIFFVGFGWFDHLYIDLFFHVSSNLLGLMHAPSASTNSAIDTTPSHMRTSFAITIWFLFMPGCRGILLKVSMFTLSSSL